MKKSLVFVLTLILTALVGITSTDAKSATPQKAEVKRGGVCWYWTPSEPAECDHIGKVTVKEIYEKGFRVVSTARWTTGKYILFIIEEQ